MPLKPRSLYALASKPILWSNNGYLGPTDPKVQGGFVEKYGYGGEEWNGDNRRHWRGHRYFSTDWKPKLDAFAQFGHLGLLMTAMRGDVQYVVGVACGVFTVEEEETTKLHKVFGLDHVGSQLWERPKVKEKFKSETSFRKHWSRGQHTIHWKCPVELYHWFDQPLALPHYPLRSDKMVLSKMHGSYQALRPEDGITLLANTFPEQHPIIRWLIERDFDPNFLNPPDRKRGPIKSKEERKSIASAAAARKPYKFYLTNREIAVNAHHGELEQLFAQFIKRSGASSIMQNENGIDVRFTLAGRGEVIAELKPATKDETRFALRIAIGQILEYRHFHRPTARPMIVLGSKPKAAEIAFAASLGISCAWKSGLGFHINWTEG